MVEVKEGQNYWKNLLKYKVYDSQNLMHKGQGLWLVLRRSLGRTEKLLQCEKRPTKRW